MPIKIPSGLPARDILDSERIFALEKPEAEQQRVRPLRLVILNLMPKKIETETQLLRLISKSPLQVDVDFMKTSTHEGTHVSSDHLVKFYENPDEFADNYYDGLVITGAPVEHLDFAQVDYWPEFKEIVDWASRHVFSTMYLCWGAMGALNYRYGVRKELLDEKIFGVFPQYLQDEYCFLTNGFDEIALQPHSRLAGVNEADVAANPDLQVLTWGPQSGPGLIATRDFSEVFALGHW
ncbi:MAG: homoserine O-succinyltransferase, partial [Bifidobacterium tibiigranuli]|nr:homoserine O-succinyltransferase [Bifidobacterium tibiigranuli]